MATADSQEEAVESELDIPEEALDEAWAQVLGLGDAVDEDDDVRTTAELAEKYGRCPSTIRARLRAALKAGTVERVTARRRTTDGKAQLVPAYRLLGEGLNIEDARKCT